MFKKYKNIRLQPIQARIKCIPSVNFLKQYVNSKESDNFMSIYKCRVQLNMSRIEGRIFLFVKTIHLKLDMSLKLSWTIERKGHRRMMVALLLVRDVRRVGKTLYKGP